MNPGLLQLASLAAAHPLAPACDHFYFLRHGQTECNARRIFQAAERAERLVGGLEDAPRVALGLAMAQEVEMVAGR